MKSTKYSFNRPYEPPGLFVYGQSTPSTDHSDCLVTLYPYFMTHRYLMSMIFLSFIII